MRIKCVLEPLAVISALQLRSSEGYLQDGAYQPFYSTRSLYFSLPPSPLLPFLLPPVLPSSHPFFLRCFSCRPKTAKTNQRLAYPRQNGERSLSVPFTREDTASTKPDDKPQEKTTNNKEEAGGEGAQGNSPPQKPSKSKLTQDFRTEKGFAGYAAAAQRGDLVTFDVVLNRG